MLPPSQFRRFDCDIRVHLLIAKTFNEFYCAAVAAVSISSKESLSLSGEVSFLLTGSHKSLFAAC